MTLMMVMIVMIILVILKVQHLPINAGGQLGKRLQNDNLHLGFTHSLSSVRDHPSYLIQVKTMSLPSCSWFNWPTSLCAVETNKYVQQNNRPKWVDVSADEVWIFLGIVILMGIHRLLQIKDYWGMDSLLCVSAVQQSMSLRRFCELWANLHLVDNETAPTTGGPARKIHPLLDILTYRLLVCYNPRQNFSIEEIIVKYKGRAKGKVHMPKKLVKVGYKVWCCSCSCCGQLCNFQVYDGRATDPVSRKQILRND